MTSAGNSSKSFVGWLAAFFLAVLGAHCWLVWLYGSALPFWDQWDEALTLFKPWVDGHLTWADIAAPASDHRIILTHFLDLGLVELNGRWDPLLQMAVNAFIHAASASGLAFCLWHFGGRRNAWLVCGLLLPFFALPFAGENAVWGMNSLWYLINGFALVTIVGLGFYPVRSWPWWLGLAAALLGLLTMALGPVAPLAVLGLLLLRALKARRFGREALITLAVCLVLLLIGASLTVRADGYRPLQAHSFDEFTAALIRHLDWPFYRVPEMACVIVLPLVLLLIYYLRPNYQASRMAELLLTLGWWSLLATAILAFGRANYGDLLPASRYTEIFSLLLIASLFASLQLSELWRARLPRGTALLLPLVFAALLFWGLTQMSVIVVNNLLAPTRLMNLIAEERVATFVAAGRDSDLLEPPTIRPNAATALTVLRDPRLQAILPVTCVSQAPALGWLAALSRWPLRLGYALLATGLGLYVGLCGWGLSRGGPDLSFSRWEGVLALLAGLAALILVGSQHSLRRATVEYGLQQQLAGEFQNAGYPGRAAVHARRAEELKAVK
jgi:hypothetical protein